MSLTTLCIDGWDCHTKLLMVAFFWTTGSSIPWSPGGRPPVLISRDSGDSRSGQGRLVAGPEWDRESQEACPRPKWTTKWWPEKAPWLCPGNVTLARFPEWVEPRRKQAGLDPAPRESCHPAPVPSAQPEVSRGWCPLSEDRGPYSAGRWIYPWEWQAAGRWWKSRSRRAQPHKQATSACERK